VPHGELRNDHICNVRLPSHHGAQQCAHGKQVSTEGGDAYAPERPVLIAKANCKIGGALREEHCNAFGPPKVAVVTPPTRLVPDTVPEHRI
jgi:hypothetical protein